MAEGHGWGGASRADSNHPAPACANDAPPYQRRGVLLVLISPCLVTPMQYPRDSWCDTLSNNCDWTGRGGFAASEQVEMK
jgi:hypothetical protein